MDTSRSERCPIFVMMMVIAVVASLSGVGSAQQPSATTANTTTATATGEQGTRVANGTTTSIQTVARLPTQTPTPTPDTNSGWENATPVGTGRAANATLPVGDQDWYVFPVESSGRITVRLVAGNRTNVSGFLYDSGGDLLDSSYVGPGEQISLTGQATSSGDYYVFIRNEATNTPGAYAFDISVAESEATAKRDQLQPEAESEGETSGGSGPGFGVGAGLVAVVGAGSLLVLARNSLRSK